MAVVCLSHLSAPEVERKLACVEVQKDISAIDFSDFPIQKDLFAHVKNVELKRSAEANFAWLSGIELEAMQMQQRIRSSYGLSGSLFSTPKPISIASFDPRQPQSYVAQSSTWASFLNDATLSRYYPGAIGYMSSSMAVPQLTGNPGNPQALVQRNSPSLMRNKF